MAFSEEELGNQQVTNLNATEENAAWPLDSAPMGIKAEPEAKFFIQCYKFQVQDYVVSKFTSFGFLNSFTFPPSLILVPIILAWHNSQHNRWSKV